MLAGGLAVLGVAQVLSESGGALEVALVLGMILPVALRRILPLLAVGVGWFVTFLEGGFGQDVTSQGYAAIIALWITVYSVARHGRGSHPLAGLLWSIACVVGSVVIATGIDVPSLLLTTVLAVAPWLAGYAVRRADSDRARAQGEAIHARDDAERRAQEAVAEERARIAREVHDVLGHTLGLMVLQLGAAEQAMDCEPDRAREAVRSARAAGKSALAEVRYLIALQDEVAGAPEPPVRGLHDIAELVEQNRRAGVDVELDLEVGLEGTRPAGDSIRGAAPSATDLAAYRIVQESLTNAVRHGSGPVRVGVRGTPPELLITVRNASPETAGTTEEGVERVSTGTGRTDRDDGKRSGRGLIGMTERARSCGGVLSAREVDGGFLVEARLPLPVRDVSKASAEVSAQ